MAGGGPRTPSQPAPVSGPGALSRRTDGQPTRDVTGLPYGDNAELRTQQGAAPMAGSNPAVGQGQPQGPQVPLTQMSPDLYAPTDRPNEPLTAGSPFGDGRTPEGPGRLPPGPTSERVGNALPILIRAAEQPYASPELRQVVAYLRSVQSG